MGAFERVWNCLPTCEWVYMKEPLEGTICYISNLSMLREHYPGWKVAKILDEISTEPMSASKAHKNRRRFNRELAV